MENIEFLFFILIFLFLIIALKLVALEEIFKNNEKKVVKKKRE